jgi:hypothetical protein
LATGNVPVRALHEFVCVALTNGGFRTNSGMFRPEMLLPMGLPEDVNVIAWGFGLERPTMIKYRLENIRDLVGHGIDLNFVRNNPICRLDNSKKSADLITQL